MSCNGIFLCGSWALSSGDIYLILVMVVALIATAFLSTVIFLMYKSKKNIEKLYNYDDLTGIYNKNGFNKYVGSLFEGSDSRFCIAAIDIYRFKIINEIYGRAFGDIVLKEIAICIKEEFSDIGMFCRFGSDIFMLCIPFEFDNIDRLQRLNDKVEAKLDTGGDIVLSVGVYVIDNHEMAIATMCDRAYMASKSIKGSYVTRFAMYDDTLRATLLEERELTSNMRDGLDNREFKVYLQPKYSLDTEKIIGSEALIRWFHPEKGLIMPGKFIPIFERNGLILALDIYVLESVCEILNSWKEQGKKLYPISINISRRNILQAHIAETIKDVVDAYGIETSLVNLEITETAYIDNPELLNKVIARLRSYGFVTSIDDFGSGYSSLNTLKDVPVDILKIDLKFLLNFDKQGKGASILSAVVRMAKTLNMHIVAEGVETKEQASYLRSLGCDSAQGYFYSKPVPISTFEEMVQNQETTDKTNEERDFISELDIEDFWENNADINTFLRNVIGGFGIYEIRDGIIKASRFNDAYFDLVGCSREEYYSIKDNILDWIHPPDRNKATAAFIKTLDTHLPEDIIYRRLKRDGSVIWIKGKVCFIAGNSVHSLYYGYFSDITAQVQTEKSLRASDIKCKLVLDNLSDMVLEWRKKTDELIVSKRFIDNFGGKTSIIPMFSKNYFKSGIVFEEDKEKLHSAFYSVYYGEQRVELECRINNVANGKAHLCKIVLVRMDDEEKENLIILAIVSKIDR